MAEVLQGGCKCGRVRYRGTVADSSMFRCHCRDCQQLTGSGHAEMVPLVAESFAIDDTRRTYTMTGGSGRHTFSGFCPHCGSPLTRQSERMSHLVYVHAGSLDEPGQYQPARSIHTDAAQPWDGAIIAPED